MSETAMTRPQQIAAMKARLGEVGRATAAFRAALPASNDSAHHDFFGEVLGRIAMILDNEQAGVTGELAGDLFKARQDLRRLPLPELDRDFDTPTLALHALRGERGNLVEALENALDAAKTLGFEQRLADFGAL